MEFEYAYTKDERGITPGIRSVYCYEEPNAAGERLFVELHRGNVMPEWVSSGKMPGDIAHWAVCRVSYRDADGYEKVGAAKGYDPQMGPGGAGYVNVYEWMLEDTPANRERLLREVEARFYGEPRRCAHTFEFQDGSDGSWFGGGLPCSGDDAACASEALEWAKAMSCVRAAVDGCIVEAA